MPPIDAGEHLIGYLFEVGPSIAGEVLTFQEIQAWQNITGVCLNAWEAATMRRLSGEYLSEYRAAEDPARIAPYIEDMAQHQTNIAKGIRAALRQIRPDDVKQGPLPKPKRLRQGQTDSN